MKKKFSSVDATMQHFEEKNEERHMEIEKKFSSVEGEIARVKTFLECLEFEVAELQIRKEQIMEGRKE